MLEEINVCKIISSSEFVLVICSVWIKTSAVYIVHCQPEVIAMTFVLGVCDIRMKVPNGN